ncbi:MAG TPA: hypothetical protein VHU77_08485 [Candidatus Limnocylindria bacterium]|nr:hypothetical protein [Candidatus Limnocylindria bacterium]
MPNRPTTVPPTVNVELLIAIGRVVGIADLVGDVVSQPSSAVSRREASIRAGLWSTPIAVPGRVGA